MKSVKSMSNAPEYGQLLGEFDKAESAYKAAKANELAAKHQLKIADKDASKSEEQVLRLKLDQAKYVRKACKAGVSIAKIAIKQWAKSTISHIVAEKPAPKKRGRQSKSVETVVEAPTAVAEIEAPAPKKRGRQPKDADVVAALAPQKRGSQLKALMEEEEEGVAGASARLMAETPEKAEKAPKAEKAEKAPKAEKVEKAPKAEKVEKAPKAEKAEKAPKAEKAEKAPKAEKAEKAPKAEKAEKAPKAEKAEKAPKVVVEATLQGEDFCIIEGIGPKATSILHENGILTFKELATKEYDELKKMMVDNRQFFAMPTHWARQSQLAADGKMDELAALIKELKNGQKRLVK